MIPRTPITSTSFPPVLHLGATLLLAVAALPGCDRAVEPPRDPPGPRAEGPPLDEEILRNDPVVAAFREEAARFLELEASLRPLEASLADGTISEADMVSWRTLDDARTAEQDRLNQLMYVERVTPAQRAAMWWVLQGLTPDAPTDQP